MILSETVKYDEKGLVPAVVQHYTSNKVLMVAYMNKEAVDKTVETGRAVFFSRSRGKLWIKGETSGNFLNVKEIYVDCDEDCIVIKAEPEGPSCHTGHDTCFYRKYEDGELVEKESLANAAVLEAVHAQAVNRKNNPIEGSYTNYLFEKGIDKILKKVGEETSEVIIASKNDGNSEARYEIADLMYHLSVLMVEKGLTWGDIYAELASRYGKKATNKNAYRK